MPLFVCLINVTSGPRSVRHAMGWGDVVMRRLVLVRSWSHLLPHPSFLRASHILRMSVLQLHAASSQICLGVESCTSSVFWFRGQAIGLCSAFSAHSQWVVQSGCAHTRCSLLAIAIQELTSLWKGNLADVKVNCAAVTTAHHTVVDSVTTHFGREVSFCFVVFVDNQKYLVTSSVVIGKCFFGMAAIAHSK